jgi:hypothetical protein
VRAGSSGCGTQPIMRGHADDMSSLAGMVLSWDDSRRAFTDAAEWFVRTAALVGDRWNRPGLGEWDVRALVGHTSRSLSTVETYLAHPAATVEITSAADYFRATRATAAARPSRRADATPGPLWVPNPRRRWRRSPHA